MIIVFIENYNKLNQSQCEFQIEMSVVSRLYSFYYSSLHNVILLFFHELNLLMKQIKIKIILIKQ